MDFDDLTKKFLLGEGKASEPSVLSRIQSVEETLHNILPRSQSDSRRLEMAKENVRNIRKHFKRLQKENERLQEQIAVLEETNKNAKIEEDYS